MFTLLSVIAAFLTGWLVGLLNGWYIVDRDYHKADKRRRQMWMDAMSNSVYAASAHYTLPARHDVSGEGRDRV